MRKNLNRILAFALVLSMCLSLFPMGVLADDGIGLCPHHTEHTDECGYVAAKKAQKCTHEHTDECYQFVKKCLHVHTDDCYAEGDEKGSPSKCSHECTVENGCITKVPDCKHTHDKFCGYAEAVKGHPCTFYCEICNHVAVTGVSLSKNEMTLDVGASETLNAAVAPEDATEKVVTWSSSDPSVATVADGVVTGVKAGSAEITVTTKEGDFSDICTVTVENVLVDGVSLNKTELTLTEGFQDTLTATVSPSSATDKTITWSSSDPDVATVENGTVTAVAPGSAIIAVVTVDGEFEASCTVTVKPVIHVESVTLDAAKMTLTETFTASLTAVVEPADATYKNIAWSSSDSNVATVDALGNVTAVAEGTATITAASVENGKSASCVITVEPIIHVEAVTLNKIALALAEGDTAALTVAVAPNNATNKNVTWVSDNPAVVTVANGTVTAVAPGMATITVTSADGGIKASCLVIVTEEIIPVTGVSLSESELTLAEGESKVLAAVVAPENSTNKIVTWVSSDVKVATVDAFGKVTAVAKGKATITAITIDGEKTAFCEVTVTRAVAEVKLDQSKLTLKEGNTAALTATVLPDDALDKTIIWTSSDEKVATVEADGKITAVAKGKATITATARNGRSAACAVTVTPAKCTVTFNSNAGTAVPSAIVKNGEKLTAPKAPTKHGCIFMGWYKEKELTNPWKFTEDVVTDDMTLYARWDVMYRFRLTYNANTTRKVTNMPNPNETIVETNLTEWTFKITGTKPHRSGYWFAGWNTRPDGKGATYKAGSEFTATAGSPNMTLYAKWKRMDESNYKTGDDSHIRFWTALLIFSGVSLIAAGAYVLIKHKKK